MKPKSALVVGGVVAAIAIGVLLTRGQPPPATDMAPDATADAGADSGLPQVTLIDESPIPSRYDEAEPHLIPIVRPRADQEIARLMVGKGSLEELTPLPPHEDLGAGFWGELAYETDRQFLRIPAGQWTTWNATFDSAWEKALTRLRRRSESPLKRGGRALRESQFGDDNDTARVLVPSVFDVLDIPAPVVAMPRRSVLLVADPKNDTSLEELHARLLTEHEAEDADLHVVTLTDGKLVTYLPPPGHRLRAKFLDLARSAYQAEIERQTHALRQRLGDTDDVPFVGSLFRVRNEKTGDEFTYVVHTEGVTTLLPRADFVFFTRVDLAAGSATPQASGSWDKVLARMKDRWKEAPIYPERWLVEDFPADAELKEIGFEKRLGK